MTFRFYTFSRPIVIVAMVRLVAMLWLALVVAGLLSPAAALPLFQGGEGSLKRARPTLAPLSVDEVYRCAFTLRP